MNIIRIGLDLAKNVFDVFAVNPQAKLVQRKHLN